MVSSDCGFVRFRMEGIWASPIRLSRSSERLAISMETSLRGRHCACAARKASAHTCSPSDASTSLATRPRTSSAPAAWPSMPLRMPRRRLTSRLPARACSGTSEIQRITVAISPFSNTSEPRDMMMASAPSQFLARRRYSMAASSSPRSRCHAAALFQQFGFGRGVLGSEREAQHVPEEMVEAKPLTVRVEGHEEHRFPFQLVKDLLGIRRAHEMPDQVRADPVQAQKCEAGSRDVHPSGPGGPRRSDNRRSIDHLRRNR